MKLTDRMIALDKLMSRLPADREPDSLFMTSLMSQKLADAMSPLLVAKAEQTSFRYAGMDILTYPTGTVVFHKETGQRMTIEENSVLTVRRDDVLIFPPGMVGEQP